MALSKDQILNADDQKIEKVDVPEWGGEVCIKTMSGHQRDKYESDCIKASERKDFVNMRAKLAVLTICDEEGNLVFDEKEINSLTRKSASALEKVFAASCKLNGITDDDVKELEKN